MPKLKYFGTDGIRGTVGETPISVEIVLHIGFSIGTLLKNNIKNPKIIIGKDTRISCYMISSALAAGLSAAGVDICIAGVIPTPAIAHLVKNLNYDMGIMISASHNPYYDNGIKFFNKNGLKLSEDQEYEIEKLIDQPIKMTPKQKLGKKSILKEAKHIYIDYCKKNIEKSISQQNKKIIIDCADGATYQTAPLIFNEFNSKFINIKPNGININGDSGACHPENLREQVKLNSANLGISFDGDGDRLIMVDEKNEIVDGDEILYVILLGLLKTNSFYGGVVGTVMSNLGLEVAIKNFKIEFYRTKVGDQYVIKKLLENNWLLGGETSGHIIFRELNTSGDGIITALQVLKTMELMQKPLNELKKGMTKFPQKIININYKNKISLDDSNILKLTKKIENKLKPQGRVLLRYSGTESVLRIMTEGEDYNIVTESALDMSNELSRLIN
ncbi:phosphoglucosamine mutase [Gammaproteobacteria bacterium]|nr:phosphoglucosamine mutase [Gammaproteobacteria bacterium]